MGTRGPAALAEAVQQTEAGRQLELLEDLLVLLGRLCGHDGRVHDRSSNRGGFEGPAQVRLLLVQTAHDHVFDSRVACRQLRLPNRVLEEALLDHVPLRHPEQQLLRPEREPPRDTRDPGGEFVIERTAQDVLGQLDDRVVVQSADAELDGIGADPML